MHPDLLRASFELAGIVLALIAIISGIYKVSQPIVALRTQMTVMQAQLVDVRERLGRIEDHLAAAARS